MIEDIQTVQPYLTVFPDAKDVFAEPVEKYAAHIHPLLSIDLSAVNPTWQGKIHLVLPIEPHESLMGEYTQAFHNDYLKPNWIAFRLNADNQFELLGDFRFFAQADTHFKAPYAHFSDELNQHYVGSHNGLNEAKARFEKYQALYYATDKKPLEKRPEDKPMNLLDQLGGGVGDANWTSYCDGIDMNMDDEDDIYPISPAGNRFYFIAGVPAWHYITNSYGGADWIVLFYEPIERIAWMTFDYS